MTQFSKAMLFYQTLLELYPRNYRKEYETEMKTVFEDLYSEEIINHPEIRLSFWFKLIWDILITTLEQHLNLISKIGFLKYLKITFNLNTLKLISLISVLPILFLSILDFTTVFLTGDRKALRGMYNNPYWVYEVTLAFFLPLTFFLFNFAVFIKDLSKQKTNPLSITFLSKHYFEILMGIFCLGLLILAIGHDAIPCTINHIFSQGFLNIGGISNYCRNA